MTNKEYKEKLMYTVTFGGFDYLTREEVKELARDIKGRKKDVILEGFNRRASIRVNEDGTAILTSYYTDVAAIKNGIFFKLWDGFSATTLKHVNLFREYYGMDALNKRGWIETETI